VPPKKTVEAPSGRTAFSESGQGPVALFVQRVTVNSYLRRHQLERLSGLRRCIAVDLMAHRRERQRVMEALNLMVTAGLAGWPRSGTGYTHFALLRPPPLAAEAEHKKRSGPAVVETASIAISVRITNPLIYTSMPSSAQPRMPPKTCAFPGLKAPYPSSGGRPRVRRFRARQLRRGLQNIYWTG